MNTCYQSWCTAVTNWEVCAQDRPLWRSMIHTGARTAETNRIAEAQKKRAARKARLYSTTSTSAGPTYPCLESGRVLQARIGLISHLRTHRVNQTWHHHHHRRSYGHHRKRWTNNNRSETWALKKAHMELLSVAQRKMECIMLGITLRDHKRNTWIRHQTGVNDIIDVIKKGIHGWAGHIARFKDNRWTKRVTEWTPRE